MVLLRMGASLSYARAYMHVSVHVNNVEFCKIEGSREKTKVVLCYIFIFELTYSAAIIKSWV